MIGFSGLAHADGSPGSRSYIGVSLTFFDDLGKVQQGTETWLKSRIQSDHKNPRHFLKKILTDHLASRCRQLIGIWDCEAGEGRDDLLVSIKHESTDVKLVVELGRARLGRTWSNSVFTSDDLARFRGRLPPFEDSETWRKSIEAAFDRLVRDERPGILEEMRKLPLAHSAKGEGLCGADQVKHCFEELVDVENALGSSEGILAIKTERKFEHVVAVLNSPDGDIAYIADFASNAEGLVVIRLNADVKEDIKSHLKDASRRGASKMTVRIEYGK